MINSYPHFDENNSNLISVWMNHNNEGLPLTLLIDLEKKTIVEKKTLRTLENDEEEGAFLLTEVYFYDNL